MAPLPMWRPTSWPSRSRPSERFRPVTAPVLVTPRMVLSPASPSDCPDFIALEKDPEVMRFLNGGVPVDRALIGPDADFLMPDGTETALWTARDREHGRFLGWFCLWPEDDGTAELGYRLARSAWGRGLATEGGAELLRFGFGSAGYHAVTAATTLDNVGSRKVMEKLGLRLVRSHPHRPSGGTEVWYRITAANWLASTGDV